LLTCRVMPTPLEYWSYSLQFQSVLAGPLVMYVDYMDFIHTKDHPNPNHEVLKKLIASVTFAIVYIKFGSIFQISMIQGKVDLRLRHGHVILYFHSL